MAGDWIKWVKGLSRRPEVLDIASALQISRREAASLCCEIWEWADDNVDPGDETDKCPGFVRMRSASGHTLDGLTGVAGLADAMTAVGWLEVRNGCIAFPRFGRHNGKHAKRRILDAERQRTKRQDERTNVRKVSGSEADKSVTREEKRRSSSLGIPKEEETPLPPLLNTEEFSRLWKLWRKHRREIGKPLKPTSEAASLKKLEGMGLTRAIAAVEHTLEKGWQGIREPDQSDRKEPVSRVPTDEDLARWNPNDGGLSSR